MKQIKEAPKVVDIMAETDILVVVSDPTGLAAVAVSVKDNVNCSAIDIQKFTKKQGVRIK